MCFSTRRSARAPARSSIPSCWSGSRSRSATRSPSAPCKCRSAPPSRPSPTSSPSASPSGPRVLVSLETLQRSGLADPGSLVGWRYALKLADGAGAADAGLVRFGEAVKRVLPEGGFTVRDRRDPSPQVSRVLERLRQFLTLVGVTALLVGGVGIANAVATYIDRRRKVIAAFKSLGATQRIIFGVHLLQVMCFAAIGVAIGVAVGLLIPMALKAAFGTPAADPGRVHPHGAQPAHRRCVRLPRRAAVHAVAARTRRAGAGRVLFRDEVAPERILPPTYVIVLTAGRRLLARCTRDLLLRGAPAGVLLLPRRDRGVRRLRGPRIGGDLVRETTAATAPGRAGARHRQSRSARRTDARRRALARHGTVAAGDGCARRQLDRGGADGPHARGEPQLLRARRQAGRERRIPGPGPARLPGRQGGAGPDAAGPAGQARRQTCRADQGASRGAVGADRGSRALLFRQRAGGLDRRRRHLVAGRTTAASRWSRSRPRSPRSSISSSAGTSPSTCSAATSRRALPTCAS